LNQLGIALAISVGGGHRYRERVAGRLAFQGRFQPRNDVTGTMQIGQRATALRSIDRIAVIIGECVVDADDFVFRGLHYSSLWLVACWSLTRLPPIHQERIAAVSNETASNF